MLGVHTALAATPYVYSSMLPVAYVDCGRSIECCFSCVRWLTPADFTTTLAPPIPRRLLFCALYMYLCFLKIFSAALFSSRVFIVTKLWCLLPNLELKIVGQLWFDSNKITKIFLL